MNLQQGDGLTGHRAFSHLANPIFCVPRKGSQFSASLSAVCGQNLGKAESLLTPFYRYHTGVEGLWTSVNSLKFTINLQIRLEGRRPKTLRHPCCLSTDSKGNQDLNPNCLQKLVKKTNFAINDSKTDLLTTWQQYTIQAATIPSWINTRKFNESKLPVIEYSSCRSICRKPAETETTHRFLVCSLPHLRPSPIPFDTVIAFNIP